jgi:OOP family OmpA-OmpF porin
MKTRNFKTSPQGAVGPAVADAAASATRRRMPVGDGFRAGTTANLGLAAASCAALVLTLSMDAHAADGVRAGPVVERQIASDMLPGAFGATQRVFPAKVEGDNWATSGDIDAAQSALNEIRQRDGVDASQGVRAFGMAKAQCWIDLARHTYREVALSGITETSVAVAKRQIDALVANGATPEFETPELRRGTDTVFAGLPQVAGVREDLWQRLAGYRTAKALRCVPALVPCMETDLVEAGYEVAANLRPVLHANEALERALGHASKIDEGLAACSEPVVAAPAPTPVAPPVPPRRFTMSGETLFHFDGWKESALLPGGRQEIEKIASQLRNDYTRIDRLVVTGHTDRLGSSAYNSQLSRRRADTVSRMLRERGVKASTVNVQGMGEREPVTTNCQATLKPKALHECLQPDRRVVLDVSGETRP